MTVTIEQTWTKIVVRLRAAESRSWSLTLPLSSPTRRKDWS